jgi:hypothetical protein
MFVVPLLILLYGNKSSFIYLLVTWPIAHQSPPHRVLDASVPAPKKREGKLRQRSRENGMFEKKTTSKCGLPCSYLFCGWDLADCGGDLAEWLLVRASDLPLQKPHKSWVRSQHHPILHIGSKGRQMEQYRVTYTRKN